MEYTYKLNKDKSLKIHREYGFTEKHHAGLAKREISRGFLETILTTDRYENFYKWRS